MSRKLIYISIFFALVMFIFYLGIIIHGRDDGGAVYDHTAGPVVDKAAQSPQSALAPGTTDWKPGVNPENMDSDYVKEVPKDYNLDMPAPTPKEAAENIAKAIKAGAGASEEKAQKK